MEVKLTPRFHSKKGNEISVDDVWMGSCASCLYEKGWYVGINEEDSAEDKDVLVKFLHQMLGTSKSCITIALNFNC